VIGGGDGEETRADREGRKWDEANDGMEGRKS